MASLQWSRREPQPDVPAVSASLWRGVLIGLVPSLAAWYAVIRVVRWLS